ncbi:NADH-ubiquinone oxidoreductase-F iron-sulfur binding region domain-containing protein [Paractinoplanes hotanensis]|uniref:SLBB domain-containing protein n=1 Tax=Paractinoplanes hotanensis TaxID=2906497 RepID=A0ABT0XXC7_9ACTN|nr:NADH-ubiquinone oxidoreductase-F iron-sulfur binding region domain-containing protein [Actinoplanes hotanensis]MCM4078429.1 SLBB domain-containing protein [Actinoplanes hotanensis]
MISVVEAPPGRQVQLRLLAGSNDGRLDSHLAQHGRLPVRETNQVMGMARDAGLTGRGGAGFPVWRKLSAVAAGGRAPVVIANGAEGEPASGKDRALLTYAPNLVLDGLQLMALGAQSVVLYAPAAGHRALRELIDARRGARLDRVPVRLVAAPDAFVAGEESAAAAAVAGRGAVPTDKLVRITESGPGGAPTLVQNVETLAHLAMIARYGPGWFRAAGTAEEPGTFLATVSGAVASPGVVEAGYGVALGDLIAAAGGATAPLSAVLVGGYHGGWVPAEGALPVSRAGLMPYGGSPGAGVIVALPRNACGLMETARIVGYLAGQVAGQCGPCLNGLPRLASTLTDLAHRRARPGLPAEVDRLARLVTGRGACRHPDGTARLIHSAMRAFEADVAAHLTGRCLATEEGR